MEIAFENATDYGVDPDALVDDDRSRCQALADQLRAAGVPGVIVPSAALPGTKSIVVFGPRVATGYLLDPLGPVDVPASMTAARAEPPLSMLNLVRFEGQPHAAFEAWAVGDTFDFEEPDWELQPV